MWGHGSCHKGLPPIAAARAAEAVCASESGEGTPTAAAVAKAPRAEQAGKATSEPQQSGKAKSAAESA